MKDSINDIVTSMIAPALFLTATGSLLISTATRIGRIVDRIRALVSLCDSGQLEHLDYSDLRKRHSTEELRALHRRSKRLSGAVTLLYMAFCAFATTSMAIALNAIANHRLDGFPVICAISGVGLLIGACINLVMEARSSLHGNDREVRFYFELESLRAQNRETEKPRPV